MGRNKKKNHRKGGENRLRQVIRMLEFEPDKAFSFKAIASNLGLQTRPEKEELTLILESLEADEVVKKTRSNAYQISVPSKARQGKTEHRDLVTGTVDFVNPRYAFIIPADGEGDIKVDAENTGGALNGDTVEVKVIKSNNRGKRREGKVVNVLVRAREEFVGKLEVSKNYGFVVPDFKKMHYDIFVPINQLNGGTSGDKVIVKITDWPVRDKKPEGFITKVLGKSGEHQTEIHSIMAEFGLPFEFPAGVEDFAEKIPEKITDEEIRRRKDFRHVTTFTIDPDNAKDFDDALSVRFLPNGNFEVGVHIADVTHYVREDTILEREARERATSVYLVDRVIPMLPEKLSNNVCSLVPNQDRLTMSAVFELDSEAKVISEWFGRTIIHSDRRFAYEEAQEVIEGKREEFKKEILLLNRLAYKLREQRFRNGAITFETIELKFKLEADGTPIGLFPKERVDAHKLIEDFMLLANKRVAEHIFAMKEGKQSKAMVYRIHPPPDPEKVTNFSAFAKRFGYIVKTEDGKIANSMNELVEKLEGKDEQNILQNLAIRTMSKARYTTEPSGHFGLAFAHYSHFTSPIRRYPDMLAHRLLMKYDSGAKSVDTTALEDDCRHSSEMEKRAADAERASIKYKQVEYVRNYGKKVFEGIVSGLTEFGIFVEMSEIKCEGMARVTDMNDDYYEYDEDNYRLVGKRNRRIITLGDRLTVRIKSTDLDRRTIDLTIINTNEADDF